MPPLSKGFDLLKEPLDVNFGVIFTTAYPKYAIRAINQVPPWGYLVKPYRVSDLVHVVKVSEEKMKEKQVATAPPPESLSPQGLIVHDHRKGDIVVRFAGILYCHADGSTTDIYCEANDAIERVVSSQMLKEIENQLPENQFFRTHRSYVVNMGQILRYQQVGRNGIVYLPYNLTADISVNRMEPFKQKLKEVLAKRI